MARELQQILDELNSVYQPQKDNYNKQIAGLDPAQAADQAGLESAKTDSFAQIQNDANRRGLNFSGIPLAEQARYTGTTFLPSVSNLKSRYAQQRFNLQDALAGVNKDHYNTAYGVRQKEVDTEAALAASLAQSRATAASNSAAAAGFSPGFGGNGGGGNGNVLGASSDGFTRYLTSQYAKSPDANRQTQDQWVKNYANVNGIKDPNDIDGLYAAYDTIYPWAQYNDARFNKGQANQAASQASAPPTKVPYAAGFRALPF